MQQIWGGEWTYLLCESTGSRVMTTTYGLSDFFWWWFEVMSLRMSGLCWQSWGISSTSFVLRSYLGPWLQTWKEWHMCCSVSWRRSFHPASSNRCSIWFCTFRMRHKCGAHAGQLGIASATIKTLNHQEWRTIMLFVLTNLSEVKPYMW